MLETYHLHIACRRRIAIGALPPGLICNELPRFCWPMLRHALPFFDELTQVYELKRDGANEPVLYALARAIAKAGDGAVLNYIPVTAPPRFELIFDERGATNMSWADVLAQLRERIDKK